MLKGGSFLTHKTNPKDVFISSEWTEEQKMIWEQRKEAQNRQMNGHAGEGHERHSKGNSRSRRGR